MVEASDNTANTPTNRCCNSLHPSKPRGIEALTYQIIDASEIELKPCEIARKIHTPRNPTPGQYSTVRFFCSKLLQKGLIIQPYPGAYCNKITYGVRFVPLSVHNISLRSFVCQDVVHWEMDEFVGGVKIHICFGSERRKISGYLACDVGGMSHDACLLALNRWFDLVSDHLGFQLNDLEILTFECNKDYHGIRLDGVQCITKIDLYGMVERVYQKEEALVRKERKITKPMSVNRFEQAISKGFADTERSQHAFELREEVKRNTEALKYANSRLLQLERLNEAMFGALNKLNDVLGKLGDVGSPVPLGKGQDSEEYVR